MIPLNELLAVTKAREHLDRRFRDRPAFVAHFGDALYQHKPIRVAATIALPLARRGRPTDWSRLVVFARFRTPYSAIHNVAAALSRSILELGVVPIIQPFDIRWLDGMAWESRLVRLIADRGSVIFESAAQ